SKIHIVQNIVFDIKIFSSYGNYSGKVFGITSSYIDNFKAFNTEVTRLKTKNASFHFAVHNRIVFTNNTKRFIDNINVIFFVNPFFDENGVAVLSYGYCIFYGFYFTLITNFDYP